MGLGGWQCCLALLRRLCILISGPNEGGTFLALQVLGHRAPAMGSGPCNEDRLMQYEHAPTPQYSLRMATDSHAYNSSICDG